MITINVIVEITVTLLAKILRFIKHGSIKTELEVISDVENDVYDKFFEQNTDYNIEELKVLQKIPGTRRR